MLICLECRLLTEDGARCAPGHTVVALDDPRLADAVWPTEPAVRARPKHVGQALGSSARVSAIGIGATVVACVPFSMCSDHPTQTLVSPGLWIFAGVIAAIVVPALIAEQIAQYKVRWRDLAAWLWPWWRRREPRGVTLPAPPDLLGARGRVSGEAALTSPLSGTRCVAWAAAVEKDGQVFLRAARAATFCVTLENGSIIEVPAGPIDLRPSTRRPVRAEAWLETLPPRRGDRDPFPCDAAWEATIAPGDAIEVLGELDVVRGDEAAPGGGGYREPAATRRRPRGVPTLRT